MSIVVTRTELYDRVWAEPIQKLSGEFGLSDAWLVDYNEHRPHDALGRVPPLTYLPRVSPVPESRNPWLT